MITIFLEEGNDTAVVMLLDYHNCSNWLQMINDLVLRENTFFLFRTRLIQKNSESYYWLHILFFVYFYDKHTQVSIYNLI